MKLPVSDIITTGINIKFVIFISILRCNEEHFLQDKNDLLLSLDTEGPPDPPSIKVMLQVLRGSRDSGTPSFVQVFVSISSSD